MAAIVLPCGAANACDTGPWPVGFAKATPKLTRQGIGVLEEALAIRDAVSPNSAIRFVLYNARAGNKRLWKSRIASARQYIASRKIQAQQVEVVYVETDRGVVAGQWIGRSPKLEVILSKGCS